MLPRYRFFSGFSSLLALLLAGVLLPSVVIAIREGRSYRSSVGLIAGLLAFVSIAILSLSVLCPQLLLTSLVGADYIEAAPYLVWAAAAAVVFTINYLIATFLMAQSRRSGVAIVVAGSCIQIILMVFVVSTPTGDLAAMLTTKLFCQIGILAALSARLTICSHLNPFGKAPQ